MQGSFFKNFYEVVMSAMKKQHIANPYFGTEQQSYAAV